MQNENSPLGQALPIGFRLRDYELEGVLGRGGFGITYCALDTKLNRKVVIKENFPSGVSFRDTRNLKVCSSHPDQKGIVDFSRTMEKFLVEARMMAALDHSGIVKVLDFFEANGTAYFVMPHVEARSFAQVIKAKRSTAEYFTEEQILGLLKKILCTLEYLHGRRIYHRDIKPENILVTESFEPILIDLGGVTSGGTAESITVIESAGYTPLEQLERKGNIGAWTDLYALGATFCFAVTGTKLPNSIERIRDDPWKPLLEREELNSLYSRQLLHSIDKAVEVADSKRLQSAADWLALLDEDEGRLDEFVDRDRNLAKEVGQREIADRTEEYKWGFEGDESGIYTSEDEHAGNELHDSHGEPEESETSVFASSPEDPKEAKATFWQEILRWVLLIPGVFVGAGIVHFFARTLAFLTSSISGDASWGEVIFNHILAGAAYGAGAIYCAYYIAPRAKKVVAMAFTGLILLPSIFLLIVTMGENEWTTVLEIVFINVGAIYVAMLARNDEL